MATRIAPLALLLLLLTPALRAGEGAPRPLDFLRYQIADQKAFFRRTFRRESAWGITGMTAVTGALIATDHSSYRETLRVGDRLSIPHTSQQKTFAKIGVPFTGYHWNLSAPNDSGTALYFLGDGITHISVMASFLGYGLAKGDDRALRTASQLTEGIIATGIVVQVLKHATGRENPNTETVRNGKWRFFPNQKDYAKHVNKYDAFPTGHLATALVTVTVIADNYPEKRWVRPLGYTLMTGLGFQMVNNGVHWWSDYPLGLYIGWAFAKIADGRAPPGKTAWTAGPAPVGGAPGIIVQKRFGGA